MTLNDMLSPLPESSSGVAGEFHSAGCVVGAMTVQFIGGARLLETAAFLMNTGC
ncbi:hypothetical protein ACNKHL_19850 [Shigella flexneri]